MEGWIKLHRSMLGWEWYKDKNTARVFMHLLLVANWKDTKWHGIEIKRGQRLTSYSSLAKETRLSVQNVRTAIAHLISTGEITCKPTHRYTLITVENYEKYQGDEEEANTVDNTLSNQELTTNKESKKDIRVEDYYYSYNTRQQDDEITVDSLRKKYSNQTAPDWMWEEMTE